MRTLLLMYVMPALIVNVSIAQQLQLPAQPAILLIISIYQDLHAFYAQLLVSLQLHPAILVTRAPLLDNSTIRAIVYKYAEMGFAARV